MKLTDFLPVTFKLNETTNEIEVSRNPLTKVIAAISKAIWGDKSNYSENKMCLFHDISLIKYSNSGRGYLKNSKPKVYAALQNTPQYNDLNFPNINLSNDILYNPFIRPIFFKKIYNSEEAIAKKFTEKTNEALKNPFTTKYQGDEKEI